MKFNLLFLNGWASTPEVFTPLIDEMREYIDKVLIIDWYDSKHSSYDRIESMVQMLSGTSPPRPTLLVGWSSGTMPLLSYLGSDRINPSVCGALLFGATARLVNSNTPDYNFGWHKEVLEQMISNFESDTGSVIDAFSAKAMSGIEKKNLETAEAFTACFQGQHLTDAGRKELRSGLEYLAHSDVRMKVQKILHPLLMITGEKDRICSLKCSEWIESHTTNSKLLVVKGSGHAPHFFHPQQCRDSIYDFIKELDLNDR